MKRYRSSLVPVFGACLLLSISPVCLGQVVEQTNRVIPGASCPSAANFEKEGFSVRTSSVVDPFGFLRLVGDKRADVSNKIKALVDGKPFLYATAVTQALGLIEAENFLPDTSDVRIKVLLEFVTVENCEDHKLDLAYHVYSTQVPPVLSGTPESRATEKNTPQETVGLAKAGSPIQFAPSLGFNASERGFAGGRIAVTPTNLGWLPFHSIVAEGRGSSSMRFVSAGLAGSGGSNRWLAHAEWLVNYTNASSPTDTGTFSQATMSGQFSGATKAFASGNLTGRFGGLLEGGNLQSALGNTALAPNTVPNTGYKSLKIYAGLNSRLPHNVFSISYGLELGSVGSGISIDWRKHIGDVTHEFWHPMGDHRILELESRLTVGSIQVPGSIPLAARFFGGNREEFFIPGDSWRIRANPVIRAIPANRLYKTADGAGAESFFSYNLTAAWSLWRTPLVPPELTRDAQFASLLDAQMKSATSIEQTYYAAKDPNYSKLVDRLPDVRKDLAALKSAVQSAQTVLPGQFSPEFKACTSAIARADLRAKDASESKKGSQQYGRVSALLPVDSQEDRLEKVLQACRDELNAKLADASIAAATANLAAVFDAMQADFKQIDQALAHKKAQDDMAFVQRTLHTLFNEVNIYSVSPVAVFDVARIGARNGGLGGTRYGPGGGIRLGLVSAMNFTVGYAWNVSHRPGEGPGAVFFSLELRDLFH